MKNATAIGNSHNLFRMVRNNGTRNPIVSQTVRESVHNDSLLELLARCSEQLRELFSWSMTTEDLPLMPPRVQMQVLNRPRPEMEVINAINFHESHKATRLDRQSFSSRSLEKC